MTTVRRAGFVALALALSGGCSRDDLPVCDACIVALDRGVRLESDELAIGSRVTRLGNGRFLAVGGYAPERILEFERAGLDLLLLQFSPQLEEMERFAEEVMPLVRRESAASRVA